MALTIREAGGIDHGAQRYDVLSAGARVGSIYSPGPPRDREQVWRWNLVFFQGPGHVAPTLARAKAAVRMAWDEWLSRASLTEVEALAEPSLEADAMRDDIDNLLAEFNGDARAAIGALLHDLGALAADAQAVVSKGYVRGVDFTSAYARRRIRPR